MYDLALACTRGTVARVEHLPGRQLSVTITHPDGTESCHHLRACWAVLGEHVEPGAILGLRQIDDLIYTGHDPKAKELP